ARSGIAALCIQQPAVGRSKARATDDRCVLIDLRVQADTFGSAKNWVREYDGVPDIGARVSAFNAEHELTPLPIVANLAAGDPIAIMVTGRTRKERRQKVVAGYRDSGERCIGPTATTINADVEALPARNHYRRREGLHSHVRG